MIEEVARNLEEVRLRSPLVHHLTNYVTVTDCANITLQLGALPVMADSPHEVEEMVALSSALVLNIGTISRPLLDAMLLAGRRANQLGIPVVLDPVGAGATRLRTDGSRELLEAIRFAVVKGNSSEIGALAGLKSHTRGVEAGSVEGDLAAACRSLAAAHHTVVVVSGARDLVVDADRTVAVDNGHPLMGRVTGTGCMLASLTGAFAAVSTPFSAAVSALVAFGVAAELAAARSPAGPLHFKTLLFDELAGLTPEHVQRMGRVVQE